MFNVCCTIDSYPTNIVDIDFSPEKSLFSLPIVRWCAGASAAVALVVTLTIIYSLRGLPFDFTAAGFNYFADLYKVPATLLAIGFTLVGLCSANHRSEQTKKQIQRTADQIALTTSQISLTNNQIELTRSQNNFTNYYKHIDEFEKYFDENNHGTEINLKFSRSMHQKIFPNSRTGNYATDKSFTFLLENFVVEIAQSSIGLTSESEWIIATHAISQKFENFLTKTKISHTGIPIFTQVSPNGHHSARRDWNMKDLFRPILSSVKTIDAILKFDPEYKTPEVVHDFISADIKLFPEDEQTYGTFRPVYLQSIIYEKRNKPIEPNNTTADITSDIE